ncbi:MAG TPA: hypothetical protein VKV27_03475 [Solirubrobacteraceae bacterium]|nr:hypothetical protein [Solirubrobacteraceae bacterium]
MTAITILTSVLCAAVIAAAVAPLAYAIRADARDRRQQPPGGFGRSEVPARGRRPVAVGAAALAG